MARLIRRRDRGGALTPVQEGILVAGISVDNSPGFVDGRAEEEAWATHRERLIESSAPFTRPAAFWAEIGECPRDRDAELELLLSLRLELRDVERRRLLRDLPKKLPPAIPASAAEFWTTYCRGCEVRRDWLKLEGHHSQARAWAVAADTLRALLAKTEETHGTSGTRSSGGADGDGDEDDFGWLPADDAAGEE
jgi:hypothetical protein